MSYPLQEAVALVTATTVTQVWVIKNTPRRLNLGLRQHCPSLILSIY